MYSFKKFKRLLYRITCAAMPFIVGPLLIPIPNTYEDLHLYLQISCIFILAFITWKLLRLIFIKINSAKGEAWLYPPLAILALLLMVLLQVLKSKVNTDVFYMVLAGLFAAGLEDGYALRRNLRLSLPTHIIYSTIICFLSIQLLAQTQGAAPLLFAFAFGSLAGAHYIAALYLRDKIELLGIKSTALNSTAEKGLIKKIKFATQNLSTTYWATSYSVSLIFAPAIIAGLAIFNQLPRNFIFCLLIMPVLSSLVTKTNLSAGKNLNKEAFFDETSGICLLFIVIITLLAWITNM